jgi:hypothetical protein
VSIVASANAQKVGTYRTHGFKYFWKTFIRSFIHFTGWWSDAFADSGGETAVTAAGPLFDNYKHIEQGREHDRADSHCVLFACRQLALRLLEQRAWEYYDENQEMVEWEANGKVTQAKVTKSSRKYDMEEEMSGPALLAV